MISDGTQCNAVLLMIMTIIKWKECHPFFYVYRISAGESPWKDGLLVAINTADNPFQVEGNSITGWKKYNYYFLKQVLYL